MIECGCNEERIMDLFNHSNDPEIKNLLKEIIAFAYPLKPPLQIKKCRIFTLKFLLIASACSLTKGLMAPLADLLTYTNLIIANHSY